MQQGYKGTIPYYKPSECALFERADSKTTTFIPVTDERKTDANKSV